MVQNMNGNGHDRLSREQSLEILAAMTKPAPQTHEDWFRKVLLPTIGRYVEAQLKPLRKRIEELEASGIKYVGTYQRAAEYRRGDVVAHDGAVWVATCAVPPHEVPNREFCGESTEETIAPFPALVGEILHLPLGKGQVHDPKTSVIWGPVYK